LRVTAIGLIPHIVLTYVRTLEYSLLVRS
jgi:hypothetical protein